MPERDPIYEQVRAFQKELLAQKKLEAKAIEDRVEFMADCSDLVEKIIQIPHVRDFASYCGSYYKKKKGITPYRLNVYLSRFAVRGNKIGTLAQRHDGLFSQDNAIKEFGFSISNEEILPFLKKFPWVIEFIVRYKHPDFESLNHTLIERGEYGTVVEILSLFKHSEELQTHILAQRNNKGCDLGKYFLDNSLPEDIFLKLIDAFSENRRILFALIRKYDIFSIPISKVFRLAEGRELLIEIFRIRIMKAINAEFPLKGGVELFEYIKLQLMEDNVKKKRVPDPETNPRIPKKEVLGFTIYISLLISITKTLETSGYVFSTVKDGKPVLSPFLVGQVKSIPNNMNYEKFINELGSQVMSNPTSVRDFVQFLALHIPYTELLSIILEKDQIVQASGQFENIVNILSAHVSYALSKNVHLKTLVNAHDYWVEQDTGLMEKIVDRDLLDELIKEERRNNNQEPIIRTGEWHSLFFEKQFRVNATGSAEGWSIKVLTTKEDLDNEARAMHNCVDGYSYRAEDGSTDILSIRDSGGRSRATVEVKVTEQKQSKSSLSLASKEGFQLFKTNETGENIGTGKFIKVVQFNGISNDPPCRETFEAWKYFKYLGENGKLKLNSDREKHYHGFFTKESYLINSEKIQDFKMKIITNIGDFYDIINEKQKERILDWLEVLKSKYVCITALFDSESSPVYIGTLHVEQGRVGLELDQSMFPPDNETGKKWRLRIGKFLNISETEDMEKSNYWTEWFQNSIQNGDILLDPTFAKGLTNSQKTEIFKTWEKKILKELGFKVSNPKERMRVYDLIRDQFKRFNILPKGGPKKWVDNNNILSKFKSYLDKLLRRR